METTRSEQGYVETVTTTESASYTVWDVGAATTWTARDVARFAPPSPGTESFERDRFGANFAFGTSELGLGYVSETTSDGVSSTELDVGVAAISVGISWGTHQSTGLRFGASIPGYSIQMDTAGSAEGAMGLSSMLGYVSERGTRTTVEAQPPANPEVPVAGAQGASGQ